MGDGIFQTAMIIPLIMAVLVIIYMAFPVVIFILKIYLYKKMKNDCENIKAFSKSYAVIGIILLIVSGVAFVCYDIYFLKTTISGLPWIAAMIVLSEQFISSVCFVGSNSVVIGAKRYFYSDVQKIENENKTYIITMADGKVNKPVVMFGSKKLNKELEKYVMMNYDK